MSCKTRIPFKATQTANGTGLPAAAEVVTLYDSTDNGLTLQQMGQVYWFTYSIAPSTNTTGNSVTAQYSNDAGSTWNEFYASASNEPVGDGTTFTDEIFIGPYEHVRVLYTNGAAAQATLFAVNMSLDFADRGPSET